MHTWTHSFIMGLDIIFKQIRVIPKSGNYIPRLKPLLSPFKLLFQNALCAGRRISIIKLLDRRCRYIVYVVLIYRVFTALLTKWKLLCFIATRNGNNLRHANHLDFNLVIRFNVKICIDVYNEAKFNFKDDSTSCVSDEILSSIGSCFL